MFIENSGFKTRALARIFNPQKSEDFWDGKLLFNFPVPKTARSKTPTFRSGISAVFVIWKFIIRYFVEQDYHFGVAGNS